MALSVAQIKVSARNTATSVTNAFTTPITAGSLLIAHGAVFNSGGTAAKTFSDGTNGTWGTSSSTGYATSGDANSEIDLASFPNSGAASITVTMDPNGSSSSNSLTLMEIKGAVTTAPRDKSVTNTGTFVGTSGAVTTVTTGTLAQAAEIIIGSFSHTFGNQVLTEDTSQSFTKADEREVNSGEQTFCLQYKIVSATTTLAVLGTITGSADASTYTWFAGIASYTEAAAGGVTVRPLTALGVGN